MKSGCQALLLHMWQLWILAVSIVIVLTSTLFAQTAEDLEDSTVEAAILEAYNLANDGDVPAGIDLLNSAWDEDIHPNEVMKLLWSLIELHKQAGNYPQALSYIHTAQARADDPHEKSDLYYEAAYCLARLGELDAADRYNAMGDQQWEAARLPDQDYYPMHSWRFTLDNLLDDVVPDSVANHELYMRTRYAAVWCICFCIVTLMYCATGRRQSREGGGTALRLFSVSLAMSFLACLPLLGACVVLWLTSVLQDVDHVLITCAITFPLTLFGIGYSLLPTARWVGSREELLVTAEAGFQERLIQIAHRLGINTPVCRTIPSLGLEIQAFAGGLPAPSIAVSDGVLNRLDEQEQDAIVAHEMGHIATGSLWWYPAVTSVSGLVTVLVATRFSAWYALVFGVASSIGLFRIVSRYFEYACDRCAGKAVGFAETVTSLTKVHQVLPIKNTGWRSYLAYSMASHPSVEERLSALTSLAPEDNKPEISWSEHVAQWRHRGSLIVGGIWLVVMWGCLIPITQYWLSTLQFFALICIILLPRNLIQKALRDEVKLDAKRRREVPKSGLKSWLVTFLIFAFLGFLFAHDDGAILQDTLDELGGFVLLFVIMFCIFLFLKLFILKTDPYTRIVQAVQQRDWDKCLDLAAKYSKKLSKHAEPQHTVAMCHWGKGDREEAIRLIEQLREDFPNYKQSWLTEACMRSEFLEHERVLELMDEVIPALPDDSFPHLLRARALIYLNRLDEADAEMDIAESLTPDSAAIPVIRSKIASDRNEPDKVWELLKQAHKVAPGEAGVYVNEAEAHIRFGDQSKAPALLVKARQLLDAAPFTMFDFRYNEVMAMVNAEQELCPGSQ